MKDWFRDFLEDSNFIVLDIELLEDLFYEHPLFDADFYVKKGKKFIFYRKREIPLTRERIKAWKDMGVKKVYLKVESYDFYPRYLRDRLNEVLRDPSFRLEKKAKVLYFVSESLLERAFRRPSPRVTKELQMFVKDTISYLSEKPDLYREFMKLMEHDFGTYLHSNNVFFLFASFLLHLGEDKQEVERSAFGALLHDIGKEKICREILTKPGPLEPWEWEEVRKHPLWGVRILKDVGVEDEEVLALVLEHHECPDGSGYPRGLKGEEIKRTSHVLRVCDVFEALCGIRPYRPPFPPSRALEIMRLEMAGKLHEEVLSQFEEFLGRKAEGG